MKHRPYVSIIIPVYKAERYMDRCCRSLFEQSLESIEFIFVNDCTPDNSFELLANVLKDYPERQPQVKIIEMESNSRQAAARNAGIEAASGKYQIHCDPDDWVEPEFYERMLDCAEKHQADIVTSDYIVEYSNEKSEYVRTAKHSYPMNILNSSCFYFFALWNHLILSDLIKDNQIKFYDGIDYMEDFGFMSRIFFYARNICHLDKAFYHYNKCNDDAITRRGTSPKIMKQRISCMELLDDFFRTKGIEPNCLGLLMLTKRDIKDIYLTFGDFQTWRKTFPEVAKWELKNGKGALLYRIVYFLSSNRILPLMRVYVKAGGFCRAMKLFIQSSISKN